MRLPPNEKLLDEFRGPGVCEWCGFFVTRREAHHIYCKGMDSGTRLDIRINLVALCATFSGGQNCHAAFHSGHISRSDLLALVAAREDLLQSEIEDEILRLRNAPKGTSYRPLRPVSEDSRGHEKGAGGDGLPAHLPLARRMGRAGVEADPHGHWALAMTFT